MQAPLPLPAPAGQVYPMSGEAARNKRRDMRKGGRAGL